MIESSALDTLAIDFDSIGGIKPCSSSLHSPMQVIGCVLTSPAGGTPSFAGEIGEEYLMAVGGFP